MKSVSRVKQWLVLLLCVMMAAGVLVQAAGAAEPTGRCTNLVNEGVEYFSNITVIGSDVSKWRQNVYVYATKQGDATKTPVGSVTGMDIEVTNDTSRFNCTIKGVKDNKTEMSCNSIPVNAIINGVYFIYKPDSTTPVDTPIRFYVESVYAEPTEILHDTYAVVKLPPYPCARNIVTRDFAAESGKTLALYTSKDCNDKAIGAQTLEFFEKSPLKNQYAIVNVMQGDKIDANRIKVKVSPDVTYSFRLTLEFKDKNGSGTSHKVYYDYKPKTTSVSTLNDGTFTNLDNSMLPLVLVGGSISNVSTTEKNPWGQDDYPTSSNLEIRFWYENESGTLGYENSVFHFIRNLVFKFAKECNLTADATTLYDPCQQSMQGFPAKLPSKIDIATTSGVKLNCGTKGEQCDVLQSTQDVDLKDFYFITRKCVNAACDYLTSTSAYPASITMTDGGGYSRSYSNGGRAGGVGTISRFRMRPYYDTGRPFAITGATLAAAEPGTYAIYAFVNYNADRNQTVPKTQKAIFYVTVNETDELLTCSTLANNGYFKAWWNDCLSRSETQLIAFEHIPGTEEAWIRNRSNHAVDFPFVPEYSYLPQKLEVASLNCKFEALEAGARTGDGWCHHSQIHVPAQTKVTITGGTMYMSGYPEYDEYRAAYMREDTYNISHLFFSIGVDECKTKKIPDTGLSLRSPMTPLKVNAKVEASPDEATGFVFTGNSLRIPAIGLGMETPIPIVHVYYEGNSADMEWDLSTLGNYVGELEGGTYLPYAGNSVLTGHYWSGGVFKNLEHLNFEDEIIIYANDGFKYTYHVAQKFISEANDVYEMFQQIGDRSLTLVTCENYNLVTNEYERRYIVRAIIDSVEPYEEVW